MLMRMANRPVDALIESLSKNSSSSPELLRGLVQSSPMLPSVVKSTSSSLGTGEDAGEGGWDTGGVSLFGAWAWFKVFDGAGLAVVPPLLRRAAIGRSICEWNVTASRGFLIGLQNVNSQWK
jgi:hypothetical protein